MKCLNITSQSPRAKTTYVGTFAYKKGLLAGSKLVFFKNVLFDLHIVTWGHNKVSKTLLGHTLCKRGFQTV